MLNFNKFKELTAKSDKNEAKEILYNYIEDCHKHIKEQSYLQNERLIKNETLIDYFKIGYDKETNYLILPSDPTDYNLLMRIASTDKKKFIKNTIIEKGDTHYFNLGAIRADFVFITEGAIDSLSLYESLLKNTDNRFNEGIIYNSQIKRTIGAIGLNGIAIDKLINVLLEDKNSTEDRRGATDWDRKYFIISLDNDPPNENGDAEKGAKEAKELKRQFDLMGINSILADWRKDSTDGTKDENGQPLYLKDLNDQLKHNTNLYEDIIYNIEAVQDITEFKATEYRENNNSLNLFLKYASTPAPKPIKTGFNILDRRIGGGISPNLYFIGAISSLGKSTFCLNLALNIIGNNPKQDILYFSLEMGSDLIFAKLISTISSIIAKQNPTEYGEIKGISIYDYQKFKRGEGSLIGKEFNLLMKSEEVFKTTYASNLFIFSRANKITINDIEARINEYIEATKQRPIVIIDYIQIIDSIQQNLSDKQKTDDIVNNLKTIKNNYAIPIFGISSFNRDNYNTEANTASFKESGAIEYTSDYLIALEPMGLKDTTSDDKRGIKANKGMIYKYLEQTEAEVKLTILKNREGQSRSKIAFKYSKAFNHFTELGAVITDSDGNETIKDN